MNMPMGKFTGQPVADMTTVYLCWLVTNDHIRFKRWPLIQEALRVLRSRFDNLDAIFAELKTEAPPPQYWKTPEQVAQRKAEKAEKLRQLEELRTAERQQRREDARVKRLQAQMAEQADMLRRVRERYVERPEQAPFGQMLDGAAYVRQARQRVSVPDDGSDLI
jgi:hypothetical protein